VLLFGRVELLVTEQTWQLATVDEMRDRLWVLSSSPVFCLNAWHQLFTEAYSFVAIEGREDGTSKAAWELQEQKEQYAGRVGHERGVPAVEPSSPMPTDDRRQDEERAPNAE